MQETRKNKCDRKFLSENCSQTSYNPYACYASICKKQGEIKFILTNTVDSFIKVLSVTYTFSNIRRFHLHIYQHGIYRKQQVIEK